MMQVPLEVDINIAINGMFLVEVANHKWASHCNAMLIGAMYKWRLLNFWNFGPPPSP